MPPSSSLYTKNTNTLTPTSLPKMPPATLSRPYTPTSPQTPTGTPYTPGTLYTPGPPPPNNSAKGRGLRANTRSLQFLDELLSKNKSMKK
jgi:hypothetical protein